MMKYLALLAIVLTGCFEKKEPTIYLTSNEFSNNKFSFVVSTKKATLTKGDTSFDFTVTKDSPYSLLLTPIDKSFEKELFLVYVEEANLWRCPQCIYLGYPNHWRESSK